MAYGARIDEICSLLEGADTFADVGCDHGYCSEYMLKNGLCRHAILSDVSERSLSKASRLLAAYIADGRASAVVGDGFEGVPPDTEEVLIAGMGGREIAGILTDGKHGFLPRKFLFQPMHDAELLRRTVHALGGTIERDYTFGDGRTGKFYELIKGHARRCDERAQNYTDGEYAFGGENLSLRPCAFLEKLEKQLREITLYLATENLSGESRAALEKRFSRIAGVLGRKEFFDADEKAKGRRTLEKGADV